MWRRRADFGRSPADRATETAVGGGIVSIGDAVSDTGSDFPSRRLTLVVLIVAIAAFMQMLDASILSIAIPQMARSFRVSPVDMGAGITGYVIASAVLLPSSGWLAGRLGARRLFVAATLAFTMASVLCGISRTLPQFVAARVLQGVGGAVLSPVGSIILMRLIPRRDLVRMMNIFSAPMLAAPLLGPPIGGLITTWLGWPWIFFLNLPVGIAGAILTMRFVPESPIAIRPFDTRGFVLSGGALATLIFGFGAVGLGGGGLSSGLVAIAAGCALALAAIRHGLRAPHPLLSFLPARSRIFRLVTLIGLPFMRLPVAALPFVLPIQLQTGLGISAFASGLLFLAHSLGDFGTKLFTGRAFRRFGYRTVMVWCVWGFAATVAGCAMIGHGTPALAIAALLLAGGCFRSFLMTAMGTLSYAEFEAGEMSAATTLSQVTIQLVQAIGVSVTVILLDISVAARGGIAGAVGLADCRFVLVAVAVASLLALWPVGRLARNTGAEMSGHGA
jgi:EmrB/QacA subfamily drug resistance transporter